MLHCKKVHYCVELKSGHFRGRLIVDATEITVAYRSQNLNFGTLNYLASTLLTLRAPTENMSPLFETIFFPLIEEIRLGRTEVDNLWTAIPVFLLHGTLLAVIGVRNAWPAADDAPTIKTEM